MAGKLELQDASGVIYANGEHVVIHGDVKAGTKIYAYGGSVEIDGNVGDHVTIETTRDAPANATNGNHTTGNNSPIIMNGGDVVIGDDTPAPKSTGGSIDIKGTISHDDIIHAARGLHVHGVTGQHNHLSAADGGVTVDGPVPVGNAINAHHGPIRTGGRGH